MYQVWSKSIEGCYSRVFTRMLRKDGRTVVVNISPRNFVGEGIKKLWSGQALLRRSGSGRKNQTKTICLSSFEGET